LPALQVVHDAPLIAGTDPSPHNVHDEDHALEYDPAPHKVHVDEPLYAPAA
jgi:hypothetical protein